MLVPLCGKDRNYKHLILFFLLIAGIITFSNYFVGIVPESDPYQLVRGTRCVGSATKSVNWKNTAFITGGIGNYGKYPEIAKCFAFSETLIRIGGWNGNVYILTDAIVDEINTSQIYDVDKIKIVHINPIRDGVDFRNHRAGGLGGYLKTMIYDLPQIKEDILIWHDCDKCVAKTNCINDMFPDNQNYLPFGGDKANIYIGNDADGGKCIMNTWWQHRCGDDIHVGIFASHRLWSNELIQAWCKRQQNEPSTLDRYTFYDAWNIDLKDKVKVKKLPHIFLDHFWNVDDVECVNHITNGRLEITKNRRALPTFLDTLCLQKVSKDLILHAYLDGYAWKKNNCWIHAIICILVIGVLVAVLIWKRRKLIFTLRSDEPSRST